MICRNCGYEYCEGKVGFGALCENCGEYLHTCSNCAIFDANAERCRSFTTDAVSDRKSRNFCEEFIPGKSIANGPESERRKSTDDFKDLFNMNGE